MKTSIKIIALTALLLTTTQALAFETEIERVGMLYLNIPLSNHTSAPKMDKSVLGFRFGQTRISTDRAGSLFTYFRSRPALFDVQFGMVGRKNAPDDIHFGLMDLKLTGISSIEKTYINGQAVVGGIIASKVLLGAAAVGGIAVAAAASSSSDSKESDKDDEKDDDKDGDKDDDKEGDHDGDKDDDHEDDKDDDKDDDHEDDKDDDHEDDDKDDDKDDDDPKPQPVP